MLKVFAVEMSRTSSDDNFSVVSSSQPTETISKKESQLDDFSTFKMEGIMASPK